ncbi:exonuclease 1-like [Stylophora pistillata]|uniref:exonuclease 1-like n=1 Tax=Stylophora pistillata TaxID=50429 RepID=UPI000C050576|nr:exonuclease 1-like [Stylophora pistillata]
MGIQGLLPLLKPIQKPVSIAEHFAGQVIGIDAYCWLHKGAYGCAMELVDGKKSSVYVNYVLKRVDMLLHFNVKPILVFDGSYLPSKAGQEERRRKTRQENKAKGLAFLRAGNRQQALDCFQKCVDITPEMALEVIKECRKKGVDCIVAPYEADAQLAYLMKARLAQAIISEDSDLLVYGCQKVIFKMDVNGHGLAVDLADLSKLTKLKLHQFTQEKFRHMCILSGCDYLPSVKGIGLQTAIKLLRKSSNVDKLIRSLRTETKMHVPDDYEKNFKQAEETFLYQLVFDPVSMNLVPLSDLPEGLQAGDLVFAGPLMTREKALGIALGNINPITGEVMADFDPKKVKIIDPGSGNKSDEDSQSRALTPVSTSSFGQAVISKRGKTEYDVQKSLSGLMLNSQSSAKTKKPFVPPRHKRKIEEESVDDDSLLNMYTVLKPKHVIPRAPVNFQRTKPGALSWNRPKKFKNPFKISDHRVESRDQVKVSRYFNVTGNQLESPRDSPDTMEDSPAGETNFDSENNDELSSTGESQPGGGLTVLKQNMDEHLFQCERENFVQTEDMEQNKENQSTTEVDLSPKLYKIEYCKRESKEETTFHDSNSSQTRSPEKLLCQSVLTNHSLNISYNRNDESVETKLTERFSYKRLQRPTKLIDNTLEPLSREETVSNNSGFSRSVEVIRIDSGYISDTEMSTDGDTLTPTQSVITDQTTPSTGRNFSLLQGSAVGSKTTKKQIRLNSKAGLRSTGLGRCRSIGITRKKTKSKDSLNSSGTSSLLSYFEFDRRKKPRFSYDS